MRKIMLAGCIGWIAGLAMTLIGMNLNSPSGQWISITGNILFFIGLALVGAAWMMNRKKAEQEDAIQNAETNKTGQEKSGEP